MMSGIICYSLLYSLDQVGYGVKARSKIMQSFNRKFTRVRENQPGKMRDLGLRAEKALHASMKDFPDGIQIVVSKVIWIWMNREPDTFLPFKTNIKHVESLSRSGDEGGATFSSAKVVTSLINQIEKELNETEYLDKSGNVQ